MIYIDSQTKSSNLTQSKTLVEVTRRSAISPYGLTTCDNPGIVISRPALHGPNYDAWSASIHMALKAHKKFGFVDGSTEKPSED